MANFVDQLSDVVEYKREQLTRTLREDALPREAQLKKLVKQHWRPLGRTAGERRPAFAVDGSRAVRHLANGAYLFVAQALLVGEQDGVRSEKRDVDVHILPGTKPSSYADRFAELMMHRLEARLATAGAAETPAGGVVFLDGALYGQLPQLYPLGEDGKLDDDLPGEILDQYLDLFRTCAERQLVLVSIAKTSREASHSKVWWRASTGEELPRELEMSDGEALYRWTERAAGFSTPVLFGTRSFSRGSRAELLERVRDAPAIVSFFVRLGDFDDALRIDLPAFCVGRTERIGDVEDEQLLDPSSVSAILDLLRVDYGGLEVYNALLYAVDREVRLRQEVMDEVYLGLIQQSLGPAVELKLDRSERRFHSR